MKQIWDFALELKTALSQQKTMQGRILLVPTEGAFKLVLDREEYTTPAVETRVPAISTTRRLKSPAVLNQFKKQATRTTVLGQVWVLF